jgi:hypothetical protein
MDRSRSKYEARPATLGSSARAHVRLIVWCKACRHQVELDPVPLAARYGDEVTLIEWRERLVCSACGSREVDSVVAGYQPASDRD